MNFKRFHSGVDHASKRRIRTFEEHGPSWVAHPRHAAAFEIVHSRPDRGGTPLRLPDTFQFPPSNTVIHLGSDGRERKSSMELRRRR